MQATRIAINYIIKHHTTSYVAMCIYEMIVNVEHDISQAYTV